jgi:hypothetical protein
MDGHVPRWAHPLEKSGSSFVNTNTRSLSSGVSVPGRGVLIGSRGMRPDLVFDPSKCVP